ncbi:dihydroxyacetone kinase phosphoryl donor subunit DhaM [Virgibacillus halodenitrificans]|uniref:phosphoenolpyruvate--glycerone phosphotransferase n=1 Tax=Virgibacillus halodenitrificans TaxID=1482 RepID=A0ABR7VLG8_VIRHA|nr:dihydroxyacetone kinase phosphoryl donor subunit DhaM [Virgibacillus halodenitrificans]MBD1222110.1 PTS-dependent dihydroxyacetone kinase phosphotransferase subunit DhaM [Virgibacillus halodenitrificans]
MAYVGIVLISHSPKVVEGTKEIIRQVNQDVAIELAGGTDDNEIGTSIDKIREAINHADEGSGVLLLYDIGSAKMNAEIAIEMAEGNNIKMAEAPIVEGAYVASVEAGMGKSIDEIITILEKNF